MEILGQPAYRLGGWLIGFGVIGLVLTAIFVIGWLGSIVALRDLDLAAEDGSSLSSALSNAAELMDSTATALESSSGTIGAVSDTLDDATRLLTDLADTTANLADALDINILGQQPFAGVSRELDEISTELETFAEHAATLDEQVTSLEPDLAAVAEDLRAMQESTEALADRAGAFGGAQSLVGFIQAYAVLSALMAAWLGVLAGACVWAGRQLRRTVPAPAAPSDAAVGAASPTS
jgi:hypothetical protein